MLRSGSSGDEVTKLQRRLLAAGYEPGEPDGVFGPKTEAAVRAFQESEDLDVDGICGPKTLDKLSAVINALTAQGGPAAAAKDDGPAPL